MAELVDALVLGTSALKRGGSTPSIRTIIFTMSVYANWHCGDFQKFMFEGSTPSTDTNLEQMTLKINFLIQ